MKKLFLILLVFLLSAFTSDYIQTSVHQDWKLENAGEWGSFYWKIDRSDYADNQGAYWYYLYFYSNSLFATQTDGNYDKAITYIKNVKISMYEYKSDGTVYSTVYLDLPAVLCDYEVSDYAAWFYSYSKKNKFHLTFEKATAYDYSTK